MPSGDLYYPICRVGMVGLCIGDPLEAVGIHTFGRLKRGEKGWFNAPFSWNVDGFSAQRRDRMCSSAQTPQLDGTKPHGTPGEFFLALLVLSDVTKTQTNTSSITSQRKTPPPAPFTEEHAGKSRPLSNSRPCHPRNHGDVSVRV